MCGGRGHREHEPRHLHDRGDCSEPSRRIRRPETDGARAVVLVAGAGVPGRADPACKQPVGVVEPTGGPQVITPPGRANGALVWASGDLDLRLLERNGWTPFVFGDLRERFITP